MTREEYIKNLQVEFRKEADFINDIYGLTDLDHDTALYVGHVYELMKKYYEVKVKAKLEEAAERAKVYVDWDDGIPYAVAEKKSITETPID